MLAVLLRVFNDNSAGTRGRIIGIYLFLLAFNIVAWALALLAFRHYPLLWGTAILAYSFGLRHAVDADHIAAIDNVTRKMMQQGKRPVGVGFYFSIGHSLVLLAATAIICLTLGAANGRIGSMNNAAGLIGTTVSATFLLAMALMNLLIARSLYLTFRHVRNGGAYTDDDLDMLLNKRGFFSRLFRPLFRLIGASWQMLFIGFLFGLGFDTATEVSLLGIAAAEAAKGLPIWSIMVFPMLFTAGMSLIDTSDGILMLGAYGWAFVKPIRKLYYNLTITIVSALVAVVIGGIETLGLIDSAWGFNNSFWNAIGTLNNNFGTIGYAIIGIFAFSWLISTAIYRARRYDETETRLAADGAAPAATEGRRGDAA